MTLPNDLQVQPGSDLVNVSWAEFISRGGSMEEERWSSGGSQISLVKQIDWHQRHIFREATLGYAIRGVEGGAYKSTNLLHRAIPERHPDCPWLYATNVGPVQSIKWMSKTSPDQAVAAGPVSEYAVRHCTVTYSALPYDVFTDEEMDVFGLGEWERFVIKTGKPTVEFAQFKQGVFKFASGPSTGQPIQGGGLAIKVARKTLVWKWMLVPERWVYDSTGREINIEAGLGKVNSATFAGYPAGTLLLDGMDPEPEMAATRPETLGLQYFNPPRLWNITLVFKFFDPPPGTATRGHNLAPDVSTAPNILWYPVAGPGGAPPYSSYDFTQIFAPAVG